MSAIINYIAGGKTGDLLHTLMVVKYHYDKYGKKGNLYITQGGTNYGGDNFSLPLEKVYEDLNYLIEYQDYINSFEIYQGQKIDINLNDWRNSPLLYKTNWIDLLCNTYNVEPVLKNWLDYLKVDDYKDYTIIHRSLQRHNPLFPWNEILEKEKCLFITTNSLEADIFKSKYPIDTQVVNSISELALVINSGKKFVGNMSAPLALAHALGKHRLAELSSNDQIHYLNDQKYLDNYWYIKDGESKIPLDFLKI